jgi:protein TonB
MNKSSKSFATILSTIVILFFASGYVAAQEDLDKMPMPEGGIAAIAKNVIYPDEAKKTGVQGKVIVLAKIDKDGNVISAKVRKSIDKFLDQAAITAIKNTKFTPGENNGKKVKAEVCIPISFKLDKCKEDKNGTEKKS